MSREVPAQQLIPRNLVDHELTHTHSHRSQGRQRTGAHRVVNPAQPRPAIHMELLLLLPHGISCIMNLDHPSSHPPPTISPSLSCGIFFLLWGQLPVSEIPRCALSGLSCPWIRALLSRTRAQLRSHSVDGSPTLSLQHGRVGVR